LKLKDKTSEKLPDIWNIQIKKKIPFISLKH